MTKMQDRIEATVSRVTAVTPALAAANGAHGIDRRWADDVDDATLFLVVHHKLTQAVQAAA